jgi:predicted RNA-binding Zn-ribbon protein involved in translation (DUF1610 family)
MDERLIELMDQALMEGVLELECPECGDTLRCEPDAQESFCFSCNRVVNTNNPLIKAGLI